MALGAQENNVKKDCFAYRSLNGECRILCETVCKSGKCSFYKTREQFIVDAKRAETKNLIREVSEEC